MSKKENKRPKFKPIKAPHQANVRNKLLKTSEQNEKLKEKNIGKNFLDMF